MTKLLIISYDALGDNQFERLLRYPNFARLAGASAVTRGVSSVFPTNTYPVHTSVVTGVEPGIHGITGNTEEFPKLHPVWLSRASLIRAQPLWRMAAEQGMRVAAVLWPVTAGAREIAYNIPEVMARPGQRQLRASLAAGSKFLQIKEFIRHRHLLSGIGQPYLDRFSLACMTDILKEHAPELALLHLTAYDSLCHKYGLDAPELDAAFDTLDAGLGTLLDTVGDDCSVVLFSDHAQLPVARHVYPNELLREHGYIEKDETGEYRDTGCFVECCGGCAFLHLASGDDVALRTLLSQMEGFGRFLTAEEMTCAGKTHARFGFAAAFGYAFLGKDGYEKATHGYPLDYEQYKVFYMVRSARYPAGKQETGGSLLGLLPIARGILSL